MFPDAFERAIALRFARGISPYLISGTGVGQPLGLIPGALAANAKVIVASGSAANTGGSETGATSIGSADLYKTFHALNRAYRADAVWAMNDDTLLAIDSLIDKMGRPILNIRDGIPYLLSKRVVVCPSVPSIGAAANPVVFYSPTYFVQRKIISSPYLRLFREAPGLIESGLIAAEAFQRTDSAFLSANSSYVPAAVLQCHS
jgi:HK97 family phage major capsid protein